MEHDLLFTLEEFLRVNDYDIEKEALSVELVSHPDFPSLKSITDTLSVLGIENLAVELSREAFEKIDEPVLANVVVDGQSQIVLILSHDTDTVELCIGASNGPFVNVKKGDFLNIWTGSLLVIDKPKKRRSKRFPPKAALMFVLVLGLSLRFLQQPFSVEEVVFSSLSLIGLVVIYLIGKASMSQGVRSSKYCFSSRQSDCSIVIGSGIKLPFLGWGLSDLGVIYFSSIYISLVANVSLEALALISVFALPGVVYSWYQQAFVVKGHCSLCLVLSVVLIGQAGIFPFVETFVFTFSYDYTTILFLVILVSTLWYYLKPQFDLVSKSSSINSSLKAFRRNYHLFIPYYQSAPQLPARRGLSELNLGLNDGASIKILGITNPLCDSCFEVHGMFENLVKRYPDQVQINLLFNVPVDDLDDQRTQVASRMVKSFLNDSRDQFKQLMKDWYKLKNVKKWSKLYNSGQPDRGSLEVLKEHKDWCHANDVQSTPALFVNGRRFPRFYDPIDLENFIEELISLEASNGSFSRNSTPQVVGVY